jgi:hypothetical protein
MDKIYIVTRGEYDAYEIIGAFSSFEKAEAYADFASGDVQVEGYPIDMEIPSWYKKEETIYEVYLEICRMRTSENADNVPPDAKMPYFYIVARPTFAPREWLDVNHPSFTGKKLNEVIFCGEQVNGCMARVTTQAAGRSNARAKAKNLFAAEPRLERYHKEISEIQP